MAPLNILLLLCFLVKHVIADTTKVSIVRHQSIADTKSKISDRLVESVTDCSLLCFHDFKCLIGYYNAVSKICGLYSSNALVPNPTEEGLILTIMSRVDDCNGTLETGVVDITGIGPVYCENIKHGGGWTVFQRRFDGSVDFYRDWENYKHGFGDMNGEFWLGLEKIHKLTSSGNYMLRVDLEDFENTTVYALYSSFSVGNESTAYLLDVSGNSGTAYDSLIYHNGYQFTTIDRDNDWKYYDNCAVLCKGGWWYRSCADSNLNGLYLGGYYGGNSLIGVVWGDFRGYKYSLKATEMMMRRI